MFSNKGINYSDKVRDHNWRSCVHNCEDHGVTDMISYLPFNMIHFINITSSFDRPDWSIFWCAAVTYKLSVYQYLSLLMKWFTLSLIVFKKRTLFRYFLERLQSQATFTPVSNSDSNHPKETGKLTFRALALRQSELQEKGVVTTQSFVEPPSNWLACHPADRYYVVSKQVIKSCKGPICAPCTLHPNLLVQIFLIGARSITQLSGV